MSSYNLVNGIHSANNRELLTDILRDEWGFAGLVMTDWGTTDASTGFKYGSSATAGCVLAGNDLTMPGSQQDVDAILDALKAGTLPLAALQQCARRVWPWQHTASRPSEYQGMSLPSIIHGKRLADETTEQTAGGVNPYLPLYEYIPDGEPHVFGDRLYLYGSHDRFDGRKFCENDYVCWSAPVTDLADWRYEGVIYHRTQDPRMPHGEHELWAPDVVQGKDGRYYLYYCPDDKVKSIGVAVCDTPRGHYMFYGVVRDREGGILGGSARGIPSLLTRACSGTRTAPSTCIPATERAPKKKRSKHRKPLWS